MTAAPILQPDPRFIWLPEHMRSAAVLHGFGMRERAEWRVLHALGTLWYSDGAAAIDSGIPATGQRPAMSDYLQGLLCIRDRALAEPCTDGDYARVGAAIIAAAYHGMVTDLWLPTWEAGGGLDPVVAYVGTRPVALVMPMDPSQ